MSEKSGIKMSFDIGKRPLKPAPALNGIILGKFSPTDDKASQPFTVNKDNFAQILQTMEPRIDLDVKNYLADQPSRLRTQLRIGDISDFTPAGIIAQIPELTAVYLFRERLELLIKGEISRQEFLSGLTAYQGIEALQEQLSICQTALQRVEKTGIEPSGASEQEQQTFDNAVDRIFDLVEAPAEKEKQLTKPTSSIERLISEMTKDRTRLPIPADVLNALAWTIEVINKQVNAVLADPGFHALEATWRGLKFLLDRTDFRKSINIDIVNTRRNDLSKVFHDNVYVPQTQGQVEIPAAFIMLDFRFSYKTTDIELLQELGEKAADVQAPVLFTVTPEFFGLSSGTEAVDLPFLGTLLDQPQYQGWHALRNKESARWLCAAFNNFLLREAYTAENTKGLDFVEAIQGYDNYVWGSAAWAVANLITLSFAQTGWPTEITGMEHGRIENLDLHPFHQTGMEEVQIPLAAPLAMQTAEDLAEYGFAPLVCQPNRDSAYLLYAPTVRKPPRFTDSESNRQSRAMTSLPYQLLASRVAMAISENKKSLISGKTPQEAQQSFTEFLTELLADTGPGAQVNVDVQHNPDYPDRDILNIDLQTGRYVLNGARINLSFAI
jgi:type VI secretion system protein ImpC